VTALGGGEAKRTGEGLEHLQRRAHLAGLLEPRLPGGADPGELRDLLAAQAGRSPAPAARQADVLGEQARAPRAQEVRELRAPPLAVVRQAGRAAAVLRARAARRALVPLSIFRLAQLRAANLVVILMYAALFATFYFVTRYVQRVLGDDAWETGLRSCR
jgi:hypothetical protein